MKPTTEVELAGDDAARMQKLLDALEALDDVQDVYTTAVIDDDAHDCVLKPASPVTVAVAASSASIPACASPASA